MSYSKLIGKTAAPLAVALGCVLSANPALAQRGAEATIPANTIIKAELQERVTSRDARVGDRIMARVASDDRSGLPEGTRIEGRIAEVQRASDSRPGIIDMDFTRVVLPDGQSASVRGSLASLSEEDIRQTADGRIQSRRRSSGDKFEPKWVGYGAGAGAVLATIFGENFLQGALLGGLGGAVYGYLNKDKGGDRDQFREVTLDEGTPFGIRLDDRLAFREQGSYRYGFRPGRDVERVAGTRQNFRYGTPTVRLNGRDVRFTDAQPMTLNGLLYVPLRPIAEQAGMQFNHRLGNDNFVLRTQSGPIRGTVGETDLNGRGANDATDTLTNAPLSINGEIFVPVGFLSRVGELRANWNRQALRLDLESGRE
ncbi:MAG: stalk domain-containing protein [Actinomycetota bacterium]